jgi:hypothetical protein
MSKTDSIAWPFSFTRTILIAALDVAVIAVVGIAIAYSWSLTT